MPRAVIALLALVAMAATVRGACQAGFYPYVAMSNGYTIQIDLSPLQDTGNTRNNYHAVATDGTDIFFRIGGAVRAGIPVQIPTAGCLPRANNSAPSLSPSSCARITGNNCPNVNVSCYAVMGDCDTSYQTLSLLDDTSADSGVILVQGVQGGANATRITLRCDMNANTSLPDNIPATPCAGGYCLTVSTPYACSCGTRSGSAALACEGYTTPCGGWSTTCQPTPNGQLFISSALTFNYFANPNLNDPTNYVGNFAWSTNVFSDNKCETQAATIDRAGNWQDRGESQHVVGGRQIEILEPSITITPQNDAITQQLQNDCRCNGTWTTGVPRTLVSCGLAVCTLDSIGFETNVGTPSYGIVLAIKTDVGLKRNAIQLSEFSNTQITGFNYNITANSTHLGNTHSCGSSITSVNVCGYFSNECHVSLRYHDVMFDSIAFVTAANSFEKTEITYMDGDLQCGGAVALESHISGNFQLAGDSDVIPGGEKIQMTVGNATFVAYTDEFVLLLNNLCPCGLMWQKGKPRTLLSCPAGTCDAGNLTTGGLNLLIGTNQPSYGNVLRFGSQLLITPLSPTTDGYNNNLDATLFPWSIDGTTSNDYCQIPSGGKTCQAGYFPYVQTTKGVSVYDLSPLQSFETGVTKNYYAENADGTKQVFFRIGGTIRKGYPVSIPTENCVPRAIGSEDSINPMACERKTLSDCPNNITLCYAVLGTCDDEDQTLSAIDPNNPDGGVRLLAVAVNSEKIYRFSINMACNLSAPPIPPTFTLEPNCPIGGSCIQTFQTPFACSCDTRDKQGDSSLRCTDYGDLCGSWYMPCSEVHPGVWASGSFSFSYYHSPTYDPNGYVGSYSWKSTIFQDGNCSVTQQMANVDREGNWQDLGPSSQVGARQIVMQDATVKITPLDDDSLAGLQANCPCGGVWALNNARTLTSCSFCAYEDLGVLTVGNPVYGVSLVTDSPFQLLRFSEFSLSPSAGFSNNVSNSVFRNSQDCPAPVPVNSNLCGKYANPCHVSMAANRDVLYDSIILDASTNTFTKTELVYDPLDATCQNKPTLTSEVKGTYVLTGKTPVFPDATTIQFIVESATFTPTSNETTRRLNTQCPCGGMWRVGATRSIATCPPLTCSTAALFGGLNLLVGTQMPAYGSIVRFGDKIIITQLSNDSNTGYLNTPSVSSFPWTLEQSDPYCSPASGGSSSSSKGLSTGSALLIAFFVILAVYVMGGVAYNHRKGYQGSDLLPNAMFWRETIVLIKDGIFFSVCHCCGLFSSSSNYASLNSNKGGYGAL